MTAEKDCARDLAEAERFLTALDEEAERFTFQTFDDSDRKRPNLAHVLTGTLEQHAAKLEELNQAGAGIFVCINATKGRGRSAKAVERVRAVFMDQDRPGAALPRFPIEAHMAVESSPGKLHLYWFADGLPLDRFGPIQKAIAAMAESDASICDLPRVMRLPGFWHRKNPDRPFMVRIREQSPTLPYTAAQIIAAFPAAGPEPTPEPPPAAGEPRTDAERQARRIAFDAARRTHDDPSASRHLEICKMGHCLRRDGIKLTRRIGNLMLDAFAQAMRPTVPDGTPKGMDRRSAEKALRESYRQPSAPDRPRPTPRQRPPERPPGYPNPSQAAQPDSPPEWPPEPGPLTPEMERAAFPLDALPRIAADAIRDFADYGQQPPEMIATVAITQLAATVQAHGDVRRDEVLCGPVSVNGLIMAESGAGKTHVFKAFSRAMRDWETQQTEEQRVRYRRSMAMHKAQARAIEDLTKELAALEKDSDEKAAAQRQAKQDRLTDLLENEIIVYPLPRAVYEKGSPEGFAKALAENWPSAIFQSDEAAISFSGKSGEDGAMAWFGLFNRTWDGGEYREDLKQAASTDMRGRRLSVCLMLQRIVLEQLLKGGSRETGFLARFLICAPSEEALFSGAEYRPPQRGAESLRRFNERIGKLLAENLPVNDRFELRPPELHLSADAHQIWAGYFNLCAQEMRRYGEFEAIRDFAKKSPENAARLAACFQLFDRGLSPGEIGAEYMRAGCRVAAWYLQEANRLFAQLDKPQNVTDAETLARWLCDKAPSLRRQDGGPLIQSGRLPKWEIGRQGPNQLRGAKGRERRLRALAELSAEGIQHIRPVKLGSKEFIEIHPNLLRNND